MMKVFRLLAICTISVSFATFSIAFGQTYATVDFPGATATTLNGGPNPEGTNIGSYTDTSGVTHGFQLKKGVFTSFDPPAAVSSVAVTVIASGAIFGSYTDSGGVGHGYLLYHGTYTTIDFPGAVFTFVGGPNPERESVGLYTDNSGVSHSFLLSHGVFTAFDAIFSDAAGTNPSGVIVGIYVDSANVVHGLYPNAVSAESWTARWPLFNTVSHCVEVGHSGSSTFESVGQRLHITYEVLAPFRYEATEERLHGVLLLSGRTHSGTIR